MHRFSSARYLEELMAELDRAAISARLQQSRKEAGLTQDEMAEVLKVHSNSIQNWERLSVPTIPFDRLDEWGAVTDRSKHWLLHGEEATPPPQLEAVLAAVEGLRAEVRLVRDLVEELREGPAQGTPGRRRGRSAS